MKKESKLPPDFKAKWIEALRSGKYKQGNGQLFSEDGYCCVGVYGHCNNIPMRNDGMNFIENPDEYYYPLKKFIGIVQVRKLVSMNDAQNKNFLEIADYIEENL